MEEFSSIDHSLVLTVMPFPMYRNNYYYDSAVHITDIHYTSRYHNIHYIKPIFINTGLPKC